MLVRPEEIAAIADAQEPGIRNPSRPRFHFEGIIRDFFAGTDVRGLRLLDLGPGHYDFGELMRLRGAEVEAIELDPAVVRLGAMKGMTVYAGDLTDPSVYAQLAARFDGIFCRGSINANWFIHDEAAHIAYLDALLTTMKGDGPSWISPCNEPKEPGDPRFARAVAVQVEYFRRRGFRVHKCDRYESNEYGIWSAEPWLIYTKNLSYVHAKPWHFRASRLRFYARAFKASVKRTLLS